MKSYSLPTQLFAFSTLLATAVHCGGGESSGSMSTLKGHVSDGSGSQSQAFGGSGSISSSAKLRVRQLKAGGTLDVVAEGTIQSDGRYSIAVPTGQKRLIVESLDAAGNVVASAIVEASGAAGSTVTVTPMDTESSVEAAVLAQMAANGVSLEDCNAVDLRERINSNVAIAVKAAADAQVKIKALAEAIAAAQTAKIKAYAAAGVTTTQSALFDAELAASQKLDIALDAVASGANTDQIYDTFHSELDASLIALDSSIKKHARAESIASVAFRAVVKARLSGDAVADASLRAAASSEARISAAAVESIMAAGSAASDSIAAAKAASTTLRTQLKAATSAAASAAAFASWNASLNGGGTVTGSILGVYLSVTGSNATTVQGSITAITNAAAALDASMMATTNALKSQSTIDYNVLAQSVLTVYTAFQAAVDTQATVLVAFGAKTQTALDVMAAASGSFRAQ